MHSGSQKFDSAPVCASGNNIVYAWAMDAPELRLPDGVGFKVGGDTDIQWLVLQVHYKDVSSFLPPSKWRHVTVARARTGLVFIRTLLRYVRLRPVHTGDIVECDTVDFVEFDKVDRIWRQK